MLVAMLWGGVGCSSNDDKAASAEIADTTAQSVNVRGTWSGALSSGAPITLVLQQSLLSVTGTVSLGDLEGAVVGGVNGKSFNATINSDPIRGINSSVQFDQVMDGTIRDLTGGIVSRFRAVRKVPGS